MNLKNSGFVLVSKVKPIFMYEVRCTMYDVRCTVYDVRCTMYDVRCTMYDVRCTMYDVRCTMYEWRAFASFSIFFNPLIALT